MCRVCGEEERDITYILKMCEAIKDARTQEEFLSEDGKWWELMKRIERAREEKEREKDGKGEDYQRTRPKRQREMKEGRVKLIKD